MPITRPAWLAPCFIALTSTGAKVPIYVDAKRIASFAGREQGPTTIYVSGLAGDVVVEQKPSEVAMAITQATA